MTLPLVLPPVVGGIALQTALGRTTPIGTVLDHFGIVLPFSTAGAAIAEAFVGFPFLVITVDAALRQRDDHYEEVAATLGARPWRRFWRVTLPLAAPSIAAGAALCWARALGEFGATITFAGSFPGTTETLPIAAYSSSRGRAGRRGDHAVAPAARDLGARARRAARPLVGCAPVTLHARMRRRLGSLDLDCEVEMQPDVTVAVLGPNGAGKTTLLRIIAGSFPWTMDVSRSTARCSRTRRAAHG